MFFFTFYCYFVALFYGIDEFEADWANRPRSESSELFPTPPEKSTGVVFTLREGFDCPPIETSKNVFDIICAKPVKFRENLFGRVNTGVFVNLPENHLGVLSGNKFLMGKGLFMFQSFVNSGCPQDINLWFKNANYNKSRTILRGDVVAHFAIVKTCEMASFGNI